MFSKNKEYDLSTPLSQPFPSSLLQPPSSFRMSALKGASTTDDVIRPDFFEKALRSILTCSFEVSDYNDAERLWLLKELEKRETSDNRIQIGFVESTNSLYNNYDRNHIVWALTNHPTLAEDLFELAIRFSNDEEVQRLLKPHFITELNSSLISFLPVYNTYIRNLAKRLDVVGLIDLKTIVERALDEIENKNKSEKSSHPETM
jgi:hypothetical protein